MPQQNHSSRIPKVSSQTKTTPSSQQPLTHTQPSLSADFEVPANAAALQRTLGNHAVQQLIASGKLQGRAQKFTADVEQAKTADSHDASNLPNHVIQRMWRVTDFEREMSRVEAIRKNFIGITHALHLYDARLQQYIDARLALDPRETNYYPIRDTALAALKALLPPIKEAIAAYKKNHEKSLLHQKQRDLANHVVDQLSGQVNAEGANAPQSIDLRQADNQVKNQRQQNIETKNQDFHNRNQNLFLPDAAKQNAVAGVAGGAVNTVGLATYNPVAGGPIAAPLTGYTKPDKPENSQPGALAGIYSGDPRAAVRSVATFEVSELLKLGIIPQTALTASQGADGKTQVGQVMEKALGSTGQGPSAIRNKQVTAVEKEKILAAVAPLTNPAATPDQKKAAKAYLQDNSFIEYQGEYYKSKDAVYNFNWLDPLLQKELSTLQLFDLIVGHVDRHAGNYIIDYDAASPLKTVRGVKGIDNDDVFPEYYTNVEDQRMQAQDPTAKYNRDTQSNKSISKSMGIPPVIDFDTAYKVLRTLWSAIEAILVKYALTPQEIAATHIRYLTVQRKVAEKVQTPGGIAYSGDTVPVAFQQAQLFAAASRITGNNVEPGSVTQTQWGAGTAGAHSATNSYAGWQQHQKQELVAGNLDETNNQTQLMEPIYRN